MRAHWLMTMPAGQGMQYPQALQKLPISSFPVSFDQLPDFAVHNGRILDMLMNSSSSDSSERPRWEARFQIDPARHRLRRNW